MARRPDFVAAFVAVVGASLAALSFASLAAASLAAPGEPRLEAARRGEAVRPEDLEKAASASRRAAGWFERCRHDTNAVLALSLAGHEDRELEPIVERTLARCPTSPFNWMRLALIRERQGDGHGARAAWRMSVLTGAQVPRLDELRLAAGLRLFSQDDEEHRELLAQQVRAMARNDVHAVAAIARRTGATPLVQGILRDEPAREAFDRAVGG